MHDIFLLFISAMDVDRCFSVDPVCSRSPLISDWVRGVGFHEARKVGLCGWSDDRLTHVFHDAVVHLDPFSPFVLEPTRVGGGEGGVVMMVMRLWIICTTATIVLWMIGSGRSFVARCSCWSSPFPRQQWKRSWGWLMRW